ncbi:MAG: Gfo/Idh/MocA family oxidoreductase [Leptospiraceae bacterium]|nr:Gfo/Idh/MocA family oxidoreductase [Leptospiraceae bacterium]
MTEKVKLGLVGTGHMGQYHVNVAVGMEPYEIVGICDANAEQLQTVAERFDLKAYSDFEVMLAEVDAVAIAVPTVLHFEIARKALEAGKHVLVEKPITTSVAQAEELVHIAESKQLVLQVGHIERFNGAVLELGKVVSEPYLIESRRLAPFNKRISDVGVVLDLMIHDIDIILNLVSKPVKSVHARGSSVFSKHEDYAAATIHFEGGCVANIVASRVTQTKIRRLSISQKNAFILQDFATQDIEIHRQASSAYLMTREELKYKQESFIEHVAVHRDNPLRQEHQHFVDTIRGKCSSIVSPQEELRTLKIASDILQDVQKNLIVVG